MALPLVSTDGLTVAVFAFGERPRGIVAIGGSPVGVLAIGGAARGLVAVGMLAVGVVAIGCAALGASAWGVGVMAGGKVRGIGAGIGVDVGILGFDPELLGALPPEGSRGGWWTKLLVYSLLVAGAVGAAWALFPDDVTSSSSSGDPSD